MKRKHPVIEDGMEVSLPVPLTIKGKEHSKIKVRGLRGGDLRRASMLLERKKPDYKAYVSLLRAGIAEIVDYGEPGDDIVRDMPWVNAETIYHYMTLIDQADPEESVTLIRPCATCGGFVHVKADLMSRTMEIPKHCRFLGDETHTFTVKIDTDLKSVEHGVTHNSVTIGLVTLDDMIDMLSRAGDQSGDIEYWHLLYMIYAIGPKPKGDFGIEVIEEMRPRDIRMLLKLYYDNEPHLSSVGPATCPKCSTEVQIGRIVYPSELMLRGPLAM